MLVKINKLLLYGLLFAVFFVAFFWRFINFYQYLGLLFVLWIFANKATLRIQLRWICYFFVIFFSALLSINTVESYKWLYMILIITLCSSIAKTYYNYREVLLNLFFWGSAFHCFFIILQYINFPAVLFFIESVVPPEVAEYSIESYFDFGICTGIAGEASFAMLYSSFVFFYGFIKFVSGNNKQFIPFILLGFICILLNGKRIAIVINVISVLVSYYLIIRSSTKKKGNFFTILIVIILICGVAMYTDLASLLMEKNEALLESGDFSNGRNELNKQMIEIFKEYPLFGIGPFSTNFYTGSNLGHNIYLTTLSENGILGFICLVVLLVLNFYDTYCRFKNGDTSIYMFVSIYIQIFFIIYGFTGNPLYGTQFLTSYIIFAINENRNINIS